MRRDTSEPDKKLIIVLYGRTALLRRMVSATTDENSESSSALSYLDPDPQLFFLSKVSANNTLGIAWILTPLLQAPTHGCRGLERGFGTKDALP